MKSTNLGRAEGLPTIEWSRVETQLADLLTHDDPRSPDRSTFWLTTLNTDGSPYVTSVGALWHAGSCWFQTGERTRKARNVARDQRCTISVATQGFDVMIAGDAQRVTDSTIVAEIAALWAQSGWPAQPDDSGVFLMAFEPSLFGDPDDIAARLTDLLERVRGARPADPAVPVRAPNDRAAATMAAIRERGIAVSDELSAALEDLR